MGPHGLYPLQYTHDVSVDGDPSTETPKLYSLYALAARRGASDSGNVAPKSSFLDGLSLSKNPPQRSNAPTSQGMRTDSGNGPPLRTMVFVPPELAKAREPGAECWPNHACAVDSEQLATMFEVPACSRAPNFENLATRVGLSAIQPRIALISTKIASPTTSSSFDVPNGRRTACIGNRTARGPDTPLAQGQCQA